MEVFRAAMQSGAKIMPLRDETISNSKEYPWKIQLNIVQWAIRSSLTGK